MRIPLLGEGSRSSTLQSWRPMARLDFVQQIMGGVNILVLLVTNGKKKAIITCFGMSKGITRRPVKNERWIPQKSEMLSVD